jgi:hypothetical protein
MMTRKHFEQIAAILASNKPSFTRDEEFADWTRQCKQFADWLKRENPRFDLAKFLTACGVEA